MQSQDTFFATNDKFTTLNFFYKRKKIFETTLKILLTEDANNDLKKNFTEMNQYFHSLKSYLVSFCDSIRTAPTDFARLFSMTIVAFEEI